MSCGRWKKKENRMGERERKVCVCRQEREGGGNLNDADSGRIVLLKESEEGRERVSVCVEKRER